jgi:Flp pilus assembly protein TadG
VSIGAPRDQPRGRDEAGTALVEFVWLGLLLLVPLVYILIAVFDVQRGAFGVSAASRAAGRAYALADTDDEGASRAWAAASVALADQGLDGHPFELTITCRPGPPPCHARGKTIVVRVGARVALPLAPPALGGDAPTFAVNAEHRVPIGRYRDLSP